MGNRALQRLLDRRVSGAKVCKGDLTGPRKALSFRSGRFGSIVEIKRIEGPIVNSKDAAEDQGLKLCKDWIDKRLDLPPITGLLGAFTMRGLLVSSLRTHLRP